MRQMDSGAALAQGAISRAAGPRGGAIAGFQPTGDGRLHLGNLLGSAIPFAKLEGRAVKFAMLADVHALSFGSVPEGFKAAKERMLRELVACGLADGACLFEQSKAPEILALSAMLSPFAPLGDLRRMTQFEAKAKDAQSAPLALLAYPCLMAADILGVGADEVVVGEDQRQHLELARAIAERAKLRLGVDFGQPRALELTRAVRIKALRNPSAKMSKSDQEESSAIFVSDGRDQIRRKIGKAVTDPQPLPAPGEGYDARERPGMANLLAMASGCSGRSEGDLLAELAGLGHAGLKELCFESVDAMLSPIRERLAATSGQEALAIAAACAGQARERAAASLSAALAALG